MRKWRDVLVERLKNDQTEAEYYLKASLEEFAENQDTGAFLVALRTLVEARGGIKWLSERTHLNRTHLYRTLSPEGNPTIGSLNKILPEVGMKLTITIDTQKSGALKSRESRKAINV